MLKFCSLIIGLFFLQSCYYLSISPDEIVKAAHRCPDDIPNNATLLKFENLLVRKHRVISLLNKNPCSENIRCNKILFNIKKMRIVFKVYYSVLYIEELKRQCVSYEQHPIQIPRNTLNLLIKYEKFLIFMEKKLKLKQQNPLFVDKKAI